MFRSLSNRFSARRRSQPGDRTRRGVETGFFIPPLAGGVGIPRRPLHRAAARCGKPTEGLVEQDGHPAGGERHQPGMAGGRRQRHGQRPSGGPTRPSVAEQRDPSAVNEDFWFGFNEDSTTPLADDDGSAYRQFVDQVISTAAADDMYVVLDLHWSDMGVRGAYNGQHYMPDANSTVFWQNAAARYANNPAVLFDPYNGQRWVSTNRPTPTSPSGATAARSASRTRPTPTTRSPTKAPECRL